MSRALLLVVLAGELALHTPAAAQDREGRGPRLDRFGDPLPGGALARLGTLRFHRCSCAAYSPNGKIIATADSDEVNLWDAATSRKIRRLPIEGRSAAGLIFSHDGKKLAVVGFGGEFVQLWDLDSFKKVRLVQAEGGSGGGDWSRAAAFSSDDKTLFAAHCARLFAWDVASGKKRKEYPFRVKDRSVRARFLAFSEDGKFVATQGSERVHLWDTQTGQLLHEIRLFRGGETMRFSRDAKTLVVSGYGHWLNLFSVETGKKVRSLVVSERVLSLAFAPDGKTLAAASNGNAGSSSTAGDQVIQLWDLTKPQAPPVKFLAPGIDSVTFSPDGKTLAWGCHGQTLCFMDRATGKDLRPTASHRGAIKSLVYLPDGKRIVSASDDGDIRIWDAATGKSLRVLHGHAGPVLGLALFPNGKMLASCGGDGTFRLWDLERGKSLSVLKDEGNSVVAAAFSADGRQLASGGHRGILFLRDPATGKILEEVEAESIASLAFAPDGMTLAAISDFGRKLLLRDLVTKKTNEIAVERGGSCIAYSPDGKVLAVACDETLLLLDTATNRVLRRLPGHYNRRGCVVFSPDGRYLASVSDGWGRIANRSIRVFELATGTEIYSFKKELPIFAAAFSPDSSRLAIGGADATALILDLTNLTGKKRREQLTEDELTAHWDSLLAVNADKVYEARADLLHASDTTVPFLAKRLQPAPAIDIKRVERLLQDLDSKSFKVRDRAFEELSELHELVREPLRRALAASPSLELRRRLESLLGKLDQHSPSRLRSLRGIEILEGIGTPQAIQIIERLAQGNAAGLATVASRKALARKRQQGAPLPEVPKPQESHLADRQSVPPLGPVLPDRDGDPMPPGAIARLGSSRWRLVGEPRRIIVSPDGKRLAVVNDRSGVEMFDARTGKSLGRAGTELFSFGLDLRMSVALSADWRKVAAVDGGDRSWTFLAVIERGKAERVKINYGRKPESYPIVPEEIEAGSHSSSTIEYLSAVGFAPDDKTLVGSVHFHWQCSNFKITREIKETHLLAWDASTGKQIWKCPAGAKEINTLLFSSDGKTLIVVDQTGVGFWDAATGRALRRWPSKDPLFCAIHSPDHTWLATGSKEGVLLWEVATGKVRQRLALPGKEIKALAFSPDGKLLAGGGDKTIRFWDPLTGKSRGDGSAFPSPVQAVAFSSDGKTLFSGHEHEQVLRRWDVLRRNPSGQFNSPIGPVRMLSFSRDSRTILASSAGEAYYLWEAETGKPCPAPKNEDRAFTDWLATSGQAALLRCEEGFGAQLALMLAGKIDRLDQIPGFLGSSVDGQRILVQSEKDKRPCLTILKPSANKGKDKDKGREVEREFVWKEGNEVNAALSPDGKTVAAAGKDLVCFFDVITGRERRYEYPTNVKRESLFRTPAVKFSPDGFRVALVGDRGRIRILAVTDGRRITEFAIGRGRLTGLAFSPDGQTLLTTSFTAPVHAWEVATGQVVRRLERATYLYSPDNRLLAGSSATLKVLDLYSGRILRECKAEGALGHFAFSPDSKWLAAGCADTTIVVWPSSAAGAENGKSLDEKHLAQVLEKGGAADAYAAIGRMIAAPERTLDFLDRRLHPVPRVDAREIRRLLAELDSDQAHRREAATKGLARLGTLVEPALRATLASGKVPGKAQRRIKKLLRDLEEKQVALSSEDLLHIRASQALERIGTRRAWRLLEKLAGGAEMSPRTRAAAEALRRRQSH